jgi:predicted ATP-grasp superfamily ATP-dependent carboligase
MFDGYFGPDSNCVFGVTARKLRQYPAYIGASSLAICSPNRAVYDMTCAFMKTIGYRGVVDLGYRYDARDNRYKIMDINPRVGSSFRLFTTDSGMDIARALYCGLTEQPINVGSQPDGRKWMVEDLDIVSSMRYFLDGELTMQKWLRSLRNIDETALYARDDWKGSAAVLVSDLMNLLPIVHEKKVRRPVQHGATGTTPATDSATIFPRENS